MGGWGAQRVPRFQVYSLFFLFNSYCLKGITAHHNNRKSIDHSSCKNHSAHNNYNNRRNHNQKEESKEEEGVKEEGIDKKEEADTIGDGAESKKRSEKKRWPKEATFRFANLT